VATLYRHSALLHDDTTLPDGDATVSDCDTTLLDGAATSARRFGRGGGRRRAGRRRAPGAPPRHVAYAVALAAVCVLAAGNSVAGGPIALATASPELTESAAVADALGIESSDLDQVTMEDPELLGQLAASRTQREAEEAAAVASQVQTEQAAADARAAEEARVAAEAAAAAAAAEAAAAAAEEASQPGEAGEAAATAVASTAVSIIARISNSAGAIRPQAQAAANAVVSNVPGADGITIGGTRASAADPGGHPSGLALDYMVMSDAALGDAIVEYHIAHWDSLGVEYIIWQQRMLSSPGGAWKGMSNRGSATANHMDHPHVNYRG
jgi:hypothetical protein